MHGDCIQNMRLKLTIKIATTMMFHRFQLKEKNVQLKQRLDSKSHDESVEWHGCFENWITTSKYTPANFQLFDQLRSSVGAYTITAVNIVSIFFAVVVVSLSVLNRGWSFGFDNCRWINVIFRQEKRFPKVLHSIIMWFVYWIQRFLFFSFDFNCCWLVFFVYNDINDDDDDDKANCKNLSWFHSKWLFEFKLKPTFTLVKSYNKPIDNEFSVHSIDRNPPPVIVIVWISVSFTSFSLVLPIELVCFSLKKMMISI